ncbi:pyridoxal phosphate-dependent aminotransferase [Arhodomonas sp. AD133]|uniref:pyridoxal phosphate-dependent aminotransferase n=1 Tax=Arhodomonas sp. AD133 TaxID=3415009 RepID=UPI003EC059E6
MAFQLARRVQRIAPSPTMAVSARAAEMRAAGRDVISLSAGEPDFDTPEHISAAAVEAIRRGETRYTPPNGNVALREAVRRKLERENGLEYAADEVIVSSGAKQCLYNLMAALLDEGDEAVVQAPYWVSYPDMVRLADGVPEIVDTDEDNGFRLTAEALDAAITDRTRLVILNSPANPTGIAYSRDELAALGEVLDRYPDVLIASDDIYEHILWQGSFHNIVTACPRLRDRTIVVNGVSKAYAMTGWRIGYAAGPRTIIEAMTKIQSQSTSGPNSIAQAAAIAALDGGLACVEPMRAAFRERHDYLVQQLNTLPGIACRAGDGTFYCFADVRRAMRTAGTRDDVAFAEWLLEKAEVAMVPGSAFGLPGRLRLSFATDMKTLERATDRLRSVLASTRG